ncbi:hypothetical protein [Nocardia aurea]|uniref:Aquaporin family protein n=1 Tax=Nocardia aurea TaxID=2144174 RepID=A0ABV3FS39_9NOCA
MVGSGIAAQQLSPGDSGLQLLQNSTATVLGLAVLILVLGPVSGAHFNPVVSLTDWWPRSTRRDRSRRPRRAGLYRCPARGVLGRSGIGKCDVRRGDHGGLR